VLDTEKRLHKLEEDMSTVNDALLDLGATVKDLRRANFILCSGFVLLQLLNLLADLWGI
jgi:hypothetical protein